MPPPDQLYTAPVPAVAVSVAVSPGQSVSSTPAFTLALGDGNTFMVYEYVFDPMI